MKFPSNKSKLRLNNFETPTYYVGDKYILGPDKRLRPYLDHIGNIAYDYDGGGVFFSFH